MNRNGAATCSACSSRSSKAAYVPWSLLVKDMPKEKHQDLDFIIGQLDWEKNVDTHFKEQQLPGADRRQRAQRRRLHRPLDRLRHGRWRAAIQRQGANGRAGREMHA